MPELDWVFLDDWVVSDPVLELNGVLLDEDCVTLEVVPELDGVLFDDGVVTGAVSELDGIFLDVCVVNGTLPELDGAFFDMELGAVLWTELEIVAFEDSVECELPDELGEALGDIGLEELFNLDEVVSMPEDGEEDMVTRRLLDGDAVIEDDNAVPVDLALGPVNCEDWLDVNGTVP